jgi:cytochrome d ubiquinol oxidase subunit II
MDHATLAEICLWLLALLLAATLILDGFDLGIGVLCLVEGDENRRAAMMASIEGVWHANQTWLIVLGSVLFGAFPKAYGMFLSSLYIPLGVMFLSLMARGVGLEYYEQASSKRFWSNLFALGSLGVVISQGAMLGAVVCGLPMNGHQVFNTPMAWATPGAFLGALALVCAVCLLGSAWADANAHGFRQGWMVPGFALCGVTLQVGLATLSPVYGTAGALLAVASAGLLLWTIGSARAGRGYFLQACLHVLLCLVTWLVALRPGFAAPGLTPLSASAAPGSLYVMLVGYAFIMPLTVAYTVYQYRVFRGQGAYGAQADH